MAEDLFGFREYKVYLRARIEEGRGSRSRLAEAIRCQLAYVSQVLNGRAHLSLEQAEAANRFFGHTAEEGHFFMLLVQLDRAGTPQLREYFEAQLERLGQERLLLKNRLGVRRSISKEDQSTYYSAWYYAAIHVLLSIPGLQQPEALARRLGLPLRLVSQVLEFLESTGMAERVKGKYVIGESRIHLGNDSPLISRHHSNWRLRAMQTMDDPENQGMHYSSAVTLSEQDVYKVKAVLVKTIQELKSLVRESREEQGFCLAMDFFRF